MTDAKPKKIRTVALDIAPEGKLKAVGVPLETSGMFAC